MKKLLLILMSIFLFGCATTANSNALLSQMPKNDRSVFMRVQDAGNPVSNGIMLGMIKTSGGNAAQSLISVLHNDGINIGIYGNSAAINKAVTIYALEHAPSIGKNISLYYLAINENDKTDLEKVANSKGVKLNYILQK